MHVDEILSGHQYPLYGRPAKTKIFLDSGKGKPASTCFHPNRNTEETLASLATAACK